MAKANTRYVRDLQLNIPKPDYGHITRNGNKYYVHIYENTLGPLPLIGFDKNKIVKVRALDDGHEVPISTLWVHSDYPDIAFVDFGPDPVLPDPVDYVLEVEMAEWPVKYCRSERTTSSNPPHVSNPVHPAYAPI